MRGGGWATKARGGAVRRDGSIVRRRLGGSLILIIHKKKNGKRVKEKRENR